MTVKSTLERVGNVITREIKQEAKRYNTLEEINDRIALCVSHQAIIPAEFQLWVWLAGKRDKMNKEDTAIKVFTGDDL